MAVFDNIDPTIRDWLYAREIMRRLGFGPDEIFFAVHPLGWMIENGKEIKHNKPVIVCRVQAQGLEFNWDIGITEVPDNQIEEAFEKACEIWNTTPDGPERDRAFKSSMPFRSAIPMMGAMKNKGFVLGMWN